MYYVYAILYTPYTYVFNNFMNFQSTILFCLDQNMYLNIIYFFYPILLICVKLIFIIRTMLCMDG